MNCRLAIPVLCLGLFLSPSLNTRAQITIALDARNGFDSTYNLATGSDFSDMRLRLEASGFDVVPQTSFDLGSLLSASLLILLQPFLPDAAFTVPEQEAITTYVQSGRGLIVLGDGGGGSQASFLNPLANRFGVTYAETATDQTGQVVTQFVPHPITAGLGSIGLDFQRRLAVSGPALDLTVNGGADNFLAVSGQAIFFSDSSLFSNASSGADFPLGFGDNARLLDQAVTYALVPEPAEYGIVVALILLAATLWRRFRPTDPRPRHEPERAAVRLAGRGSRENHPFPTASGATVVGNGPDGSTLNALLITWFCLFILASSTPAASSLTVENIAVTPNGDTRVTFAGSAISYFILEESATVIGPFSSQQMLLGQSGEMRFLIKNLIEPSTRFFRVLQVSLTSPLDSDADGIDDVYELRHSAILSPLNNADALLDPDGDGLSNRVEYQAGLDPQTPSTLRLATLAETSPANGESGVAVTRETVFRFTQALSAGTVLNLDRLHAEFGGRRLLSRIELGSDHKTATLFYLEPIPASARVRVTLDGNGLTDTFGRVLDLDNDGQPGGNAIVDFDTLSITPVTKTAVIGQVFASSKNPDGSDHPLPGVLISVIGAEQELFTRTDAAGFFRLEPCPSGRFFVSIDGHASPESSWPNGAYYPLIGKAWEAVAGRTNNLAAGTGRIYLPLVQSGTLQPVSATQETIIGFPPAVIAANPLLNGVSVTVPANALYSDNGTRGGRMGIAPVPSDRLPEPLPPGIVHALDISIQTDGPQNIDRPLPVRFPNLPDPVTGKKLAPGAKSALMSYNHDTGRWEIQGPMTVSADGNFMESDPGTGVRQPGWHWWFQGTQGELGPIKHPHCTNYCIFKGSLSGGAVTANATNVCVNASIKFTAKDVMDSGGTNRTICYNSDGKVVSDKTSPISGSVEYEWKIYRDGSQVSSGSGPAASITATNGGIYTCQFTAKANRECAPSDITLPPGPSVTVSGLRKVVAMANGFMNQASQCQNTAVNFSAQVDQLNCGTLTYLWDFFGHGTSTNPSPSFLFPGFGDYPVTLTVSCTGQSCSDTKSDTVTVRIRDIQGVDGKGNGQDAVTVYVGQPVSFTATTTPPNYSGVDFNWDFGDGTNALGAAVVHAYSAVGDYPATVTARCGSGSGPTVSDSVAVHVTAPPRPPIEADIVDEPPSGGFASGVDPASIKLTINTVQVTPSITPIPGGFHIYYVPNAGEVPNPTNPIHLEASDNALGDGTVGNTVTADWNYPGP